jgi:hypothetical protein
VYSSLLHAREVEDMQMASKYNINPPPARFWVRGRWRRREWYQKGLLLFLHAREVEAAACPNVFSMLVVRREVGKVRRTNCGSPPCVPRGSPTPWVSFLPVPNPQVLPKSINIDFGSLHPSLEGRS